MRSKTAGLCLRNSPMRCGPLLILHATDLRLLHLLQVKLHQFLTEGGYRTEPQEAFDPGLDVGQSAPQRRRQPAQLAATVLPPCWAISGLAPSPAATNGSAA